jgi:hypothetical protein
VQLSLNGALRPVRPVHRPITVAGRGRARGTDGPLRYVAYSEARIPDQLRRLLGELGVAVHVELDEFRSALLQADAAICFLETLDGPGWEALLRLRVERAVQPMLIVTRLSRHNARALARAAFSDAEFLDSPIGSIAAAIAALGRTTCLHTAARELRRHLGGRDPEVAEALARACLRMPTIRTVAEIAAIMGYHRSTLVKRWRQIAAPRSTPHLFLDWLRLIHALRVRACGQQTWCAVAEELGVSEKTLAASAHRMFGCRLRDAEHLTTGEAVDRVMRMFCTTPARRFDEEQSPTQSPPS